MGPSVLHYVVLGFAPGLFWLWYFRRKDDLEPEPRHLLILAFLVGGASAFLALALRPSLEALLPVTTQWYGVVIDAYGVTALFEELIKLTAFVAVAYVHPQLDEPLDGIIYGVAVALGFASIENVIYLEATGNVAVVAQRAFTAVLAHVSFTGSIGYFFGAAKFSRGLRKPMLMVTGLVGAVILHGTYDYFLFTGGKNALLSLAVVLPLSLVMLGLKVKWHRARSGEYHPKRA